MAYNAPGKGDVFKAPSTGHSLYHETWSPSSSSRGLAVFLPGVHESADTRMAQRLGNAFKEAGIQFVCLEHHGHGRSSGQRAFVKSWDTLCIDTKEFVRHQVSETKCDKFILLGHSMGGGLAAWVGDDLKKEYADRFAGEVLYGPALSGGGVDAFTEALLTAVCYIAPWAPLGPPENPEAAMDPEEAKYYRESGQNYLGKMRLNTGKMFLNFFRLCDKTIKEGKLALGFPFVIFHGDKDHTVPVKGSERLMSVSTSSDKTLVVLPGFDHQPVCQAGWENVVKQSVDWAGRRLASRNI